jgi:hypothetical protein
MRGYYINLDRKPERRRRMEAEFSRFKLSSFYERVSAVDGQPGAPEKAAGAFGCFRSHLKVAEIGARAGSAIHVLEDDAILSSRLKPFLASPACAAALQRYDLLFLDMWVKNEAIPRYRDALARARGGYELMDLRGIRISATDSYLVGQRSLKKLAVMLAGEAAKGPRVAVDVFYWKMVEAGFLTAAVTVPFLTCVDIETGAESSIQKLSSDHQRESIMLRTSFFVDRDRQPSLGQPADAGGQRRD